MRWIGLLVLLAGCDQLLGLHKLVDGAIDAPPCASTLTPGDYSAYTTLFGNQLEPTLDRNQTLMYMMFNGALSYSQYTGTWSAPMVVPSLDDPSFEHRPALSYDARTIFFTRMGTYDRPYEAHTSGDVQIWDTPSAITYPSALGDNDIVFGVPTDDGTRVIAMAGLNNHYHLTELALASGKWTVLDTTGALYQSGGDLSDTGAQLSPDGCALVFARHDNAPISNHYIMLSKRGSDGNFATPELLFTRPTPLDAQHPWLAPDGLTLYFSDDANLYIAHRM